MSAIPTPGDWEIGYGGGITGPTVPNLDGATVAESLAHRESELAGTEAPPAKHVIVSVRDVDFAGYDSNEKCSSVVAIFPERGGQEHANAALFAVAKDLLAICEYAAKTIEDWPSLHPDNGDHLHAYVLPMLRKAIAKSKREKP